MRPRRRIFALGAAVAVVGSTVAAQEPRLPRPRPAEEASAAAAAKEPVATDVRPNASAAVSAGSRDTSFERLARRFEVAGLVRLPRPRPTGPGEAPGYADMTDAAATEAAATALVVPAPLPAPELGPAPPDVAAEDGPGAASPGEPPEGAPRVPRARPKPGKAILATLTPPKAAPKSIRDRPFSGPTFSDAEEASCRVRLRGMGVEFEEASPLDPGGACYVANPITITSLGAGVAMKPAGTLNCPTALALAEWVRDAVVPAAKRELGAVPTSITHASTYVCRSRYNRPGAKISEHAFGSAVDIAAIRFTSRDTYEVKRQTAAPERRFQAAIRGAACEHFTTVLGPGSNAAHETHLHFDTAQRRGGYRLCELDPPASVAEARGETADEKTSRE